MDIRHFQRSKTRFGENRLFDPWTPYDPKTPSRSIDESRKKAFLPDSDQTLFIQIGVD